MGVRRTDHGHDEAGPGEDYPPMPPSASPSPPSGPPVALGPPPGEVRTRDNELLLASARSAAVPPEELEGRLSDVSVRIQTRSSYSTVEV